MNCQHARQDTAASGNVYCMDCGQRMIPAPPVVQRPMDARCMQWTKAADRGPPRGEVYYAAIERPRGVIEVVRVPAGCKPPENVAYWCPDLLGLPHAA